MAKLILSLSLLLVPLAAAAQTEARAGEARFDCQLRLVSGAIMTNASPVTIAFGVSGKTLQGIRVVDAGGILYPGGNMASSQKPDGTSVLGSRPLPQERPGMWTGRAGKKTYDLELNSGAVRQAVRLKLGVKVGANGQLPLLWQATGEPMFPGAPGIGGSGTGFCKRVNAGMPAS